MLDDAGNVPQPETIRCPIEDMIVNKCFEQGGSET